MDFSIGSTILSVIYLENNFDPGEFDELILNMALIAKYEKIAQELDEKLKPKSKRK
jgi:hypothetical protein